MDYQNNANKFLLILSKYINNYIINEKSELVKNGNIAYLQNILLEYNKHLENTKNRMSGLFNNDIYIPYSNGLYNESYTKFEEQINKPVNHLFANTSKQNTKKIFNMLNKLKTIDQFYKFISVLSHYTNNHIDNCDNKLKKNIARRKLHFILQDYTTYLVQKNNKMKSAFTSIYNFFYIYSFDIAIEKYKDIEPQIIMAAYDIFTNIEPTEKEQLFKLVKKINAIKI